MSDIDSGNVTTAPAGNDTTGNGESPRMPLKRPGVIRRTWRRWNLAQRVLAVILTIVVVLMMTTGISAGTLYALGAHTIAQYYERTDTPKNVTYDGHQWELNTDVVSVVLLGFDGKKQNENHPGQTDAIVIIALDTSTGKARAITVPRDTMVQIPFYLGGVRIDQDKYAQLCLAYAYGGGDRMGALNVGESISPLLAKVRFPYYYMLNYKGLPEMNDAVGGVTVTPLETIPDTDIVKGKPITLYGNDVERYIRWRNHTSYTASLDRQARQVDYMKAFASQIAGKLKRNPALAVSMLRSASAYTNTNLSASLIAYLGVQALQADLGDIDMISLPGTMGNDGTYAQFHLDEQEAERIAIETFYRKVS